MTGEVRLRLRANYVWALISRIIRWRGRPFLVLSVAGLEVGFPFTLKRKLIPWEEVDLLFAGERGRQRTIYAELDGRSGFEYIHEEIDDERSSLEINRELARYGYLRGKASPEELEAARQDSEMRGER